MPRLRFLASAQSDLLSIMTYIAEQSGDIPTARRFVGLLQGQCRKLAALPGQMGRPRPELGTGIRSFSYRGYVIFFRYVGEVFEVIDIMEGHRDIDQHFQAED